MPNLNSMIVATSMLLLTGTTLGQDPSPAEDGGKDITASRIKSIVDSSGIHDMMQIATELRRASESLERFGTLLKEASVVGAEAAGSTSQNLAAIGGEFDPLGLKNAFSTIQQQNAIIQTQHQVIMDLQRKEIRRLERRNRSEKKANRQSRRRRATRGAKEPEETRS